ncbi:type II secretion system F family protein [Vibrio sp. V39_P1S14PM300]|uniref:type II secretion system F family protein n=1 Tax=Vibrio sp. V39_P1S14PM300 TaxID=1938690 RepID=UPI0013737F14|nr:type II secretion system F family protein [Vibrio sp. V39_P1S14PM300]NAX20074.1 type II secretion system F family protein [Vibrio sp. V39_P1S14PM300]
MYSDITFYWLGGSMLVLGLSVVCIYLALTLNQARAPSTSSVQKEKILQTSQKWWGRSKQQHQSQLSDMVVTMRQAGYISSRQQIMCLFKIAFVWMSLAMVVFGQLVITTPTFGDTFLYVTLLFAAGFWLTLRWLKAQARKRAKKIDEEMLVSVHLMAILWQVGLSLESLLRAYYNEAKDLTPEVNKEIALILARIDAGQSRETVFNDVATISLSVGFQDLLTMMSQAGDTGGGLRSSFQSLAKILQERKRTDLQEKVTKMSGKISVTMMAFMFPALFIVLGGPAALALIAAFGG